MHTTPATPSHIPAMAALAEAQQHRPARHIAYLSSEAGQIAHELREVDAGLDVSAALWDGDALVGWLVGDIDPEVGRVWWLGPFVNTADVSWASCADALYTHARAALPEAIRSEECAVDTRAEDIVAWGAAHGFTPGDASLALTLAGAMRRPDVRCAQARPLEARDAEAVAAIHARAFPNTYMTPAQLARVPVDGRITLVVEARSGDGAEVAGYVSGEVQADGDGYIDFVGVAPAHRRQGLGRALVVAAVDALRGRSAARVRLTVEDTNAAARALYRSLGFSEGRALRGLRRDCDAAAR